jgi:hypothetical protein
LSPEEKVIGRPSPPAAFFQVNDLFEGSQRRSGKKPGRRRAIGDWAFWADSAYVSTLNIATN